MSASADLSLTFNLVGIATAAGSKGAYRYEGSTLIVEDVTQDALDAAISAYDDGTYQAQRAGAAAFAGAVAAGCPVVSTAKPELNGTYAIDAAQQQIITGIATGIAARNRIPGGGATFIYPDVTGTPHNFSASDFLNFASAVEDYVYNLSNGLLVTQPVIIP